MGLHPVDPRAQRDEPGDDFGDVRLLGKRDVEHRALRLHLQPRRRQCGGEGGGVAGDLDGH
ncbi:MAG: hypothetical protein QM765_52610 [Myxococcales bacterium]